MEVSRRNNAVQIRYVLSFLPLIISKSCLLRVSSLFLGVYEYSNMNLNFSYMIPKFNIQLFSSIQSCFSACVSWVKSQLRIISNHWCASGQLSSIKLAKIWKLDYLGSCRRLLIPPGGLPPIHQDMQWSPSQACRFYFILSLAVPF